MRQVFRWMLAATLAVTPLVGCDDGDSDGGSGGSASGSGGAGGHDHSAHGGAGGQDHAGHGGAGGHDHAGHGGEHGGGTDDPIGVGCGHFEFGPFEDVTAAADAEGEAPALMPHHNYTVTLPGDAERTGFASFTLEAMTRTIVMVGQDVPVALWDDAGNQLDATAMHQMPAACPDAMMAWDHMLEGETYTVQVGPTALSTVNLIMHTVVEGEHGHMHGQ